MNRTIGILTLVMARSLPAAAEAQHPQTRQGFGISFGFGAGSAGLTCDDCPAGWHGRLRIPSTRRVPEPQPSCSPPKQRMDRDPTA